MEKVDFLKHLASLATGLGSAPDPRQEDLELFRQLVLQRPHDLRRRLLGANVDRRRRLEPAQRSALEALETSPDLLSPLGRLRDEPSHSRLIGHFLNPTKDRELALKLLPAFLKLCVPSGLEPFDVSQTVTVQCERWVSRGRIDVAISSPTHLVFVEIKVDAEESKDQLLDYSQSLAETRGKRSGTLVYLTLGDTDKAKSATPHVHITLKQVLLAWLPFAGPGRDSSQYLASYLKSLALVLRCCGHGGFDDWTITEQRAALDLLTSGE